MSRCDETRRAKQKNERSVCMNYAWKTGARIRVSAQLAGEVCEELEKEGRLDAQTLVDVSRPEDAPLHGEFEWNDSVAAEEFRKYQARVIIAHLVVVPVQEERTPVRAFFNVSEQTPIYDSVGVVMESEDKYRMLLERVIRELEAMKRRYNMVKGIEKLSEVIEQLRVS